MSAILTAFAISPDFSTDVANGLNVRHYNYKEETEEDRHVAALIAEQDAERLPVVIPFAVLVWDEGLDYDDEGNAYFDDYPSWFVGSAHHTRKGAEVEAAYHEHHFPKQRVMVVEDHWVEQWEMQYHSIKD